MRLKPQERPSFPQLSLDAFTERLLNYQNPPHIREWYSILETGGPGLTLLLAPRGHAKSTCVSVNFTTWLLTYNPETTILLVSLTGRLAQAFLNEIRLHLEKLGRKPKATGTGWSQNELTVERSTPNKDPSVVAVGTEAQVVGRHADVIICDDIIDGETVATDHQRSKTSAWFRQELLPCLNPGGKIFLVGTRWHYDDLYSETLASMEWHHFVYQAIQPDGSVLWPDRWPLEKLEQIKRVMGTILFNSQYQNNPSGMEGALFKHDWLHFYQHPLPVDLEITWGIDLAISERPGADFFAIAECGWSPSQRKIYLVNCSRQQLSFHGQIQRILQRYGEVVNKPKRILIESNAYQQALPQALRQTEGLSLPVIPRRTVKDKVTRLTTMSAYFENGTVLIHPDQREFIEEWLTFDKGEHDDLLDAVEFAVSDIISMVNDPLRDYKPFVAFGRKPDSTFYLPRRASENDGVTYREICLQCGRDKKEHPHPGCPAGK